MKENVKREYVDTYSIVPNSALREQQLSWEAKGLYAYLMSLPKDWIMHKAEIKNHSAKKGRDSFNKVWKELENTGYITKHIVKNGGKFDGVEYMVHINPVLEYLKPVTEIQSPVTRHLLSTNKPSTKEEESTRTPRVQAPSMETLATLDVSVEDSLDTLSSDIGNEFFTVGKIDNEKTIQPENKIIDLWNKCRCLSTHKSKTTKTYKKSNKYIAELLNNTFTELYEFDKTWLTDNNLKVSALRDITEKDLKKAILDYTLMFEPEYRPENKAYLPKSFPDFVYNPVTKKSRLLWCLNKPPQKLEDANPAIYRKHLDKKTANKIDKILDYKYKNISDKNRMMVYVNATHAVKRMTTLCDTMLPIQHRKDTFIRELGRGDNPQPFVNKWLGYIDMFDTIKSNTFSPSGYVFSNFVEYISRTYNVDLDDTPKHINLVKKQQRLAKEAEQDKKTSTINAPADDMDELLSSMD